MLSRVIAKIVGDVFFETHCRDFCMPRWITWKGTQKPNTLSPHQNSGEDSLGNCAPPGLKNIAHDLSFFITGLLQATDAARNQSFWRLLALHNSMHSQWCMLTVDWMR